jgi:hypothetical protein
VVLIVIALFVDVPTGCDPKLSAVGEIQPVVLPWFRNLGGITMSGFATTDVAVIEPSIATAASIHFVAFTGTLLSRPRRREVLSSAIHRNFHFDIATTRFLAR